MCVPWKLLKGNKEAIDCFKANEFYGRACFMDYKDEYAEDDFMYLYLRSYNWFENIVPILNAEATSFNIEILGKKYTSAKRDRWGDLIEEDEEEINEKTTEPYYLVKIIPLVNTKLSRYVMGYLGSCVVRMFSLQERFVEVLKFNHSSIKEYLIEQSGKLIRRTTPVFPNSNHFLHESKVLTSKQLIKLFSKIEMEELFKTDSVILAPKTNNDYEYCYFWKSVEINRRLSQTHILNYLENHA